MLEGNLHHIQSPEKCSVENNRGCQSLSKGPFFITVIITWQNMCEGRYAEFGEKLRSTTPGNRMCVWLGQRIKGCESVLYNVPLTPLWGHKTTFWSKMRPSSGQTGCGLIKVSVKNYTELSLSCFDLLCTRAVTFSLKPGYVFLQPDQDIFMPELNLNLRL